MTGPIYPNGSIAGRQHQAIAVGNYLLQLTPQHGYIVDPAPTTQAPLHWARAIPIDLQPLPPAVIFGREREIRAALHALQSGRLVEISGAAGSGKTALLRYLAQVATQTAFADGALYLSAHDQSADDLLQIIFHAFFETQSAYHPGALQIRQDMQYKRALIILDDVNLSNDALLALMSALANCTFLIASATRYLDLDGLSIALGSLQMHEALALLEHELGRALRADEKSPASTMCSVLDAIPLHIIQAAALARSRGRTLSSVANKLTSQQSVDVLLEQIIESLSEEEFQIVDALAVFDHAPVHISHFHALVDVADVAGTLNRLQQNGVIQNYGSSFRLNDDLSAIIRQRHDLSVQYVNALDHFSKWAAEHDDRASSYLPETPALLQLFGWAATNARWQEVLALYTATEDRFVISQRWDAWDTALLLALSAARAQKDRESEARLLHQHGTRALCLGQPSRPLISALRLRESLQDYEGAKVTQHNLQIKLGTPRPHRAPPAQPNWMRRMMILFGPVIVAIAIIFFRGSQPDTPRQIAQVTPTPLTSIMMVVITDTPAPPEVPPTSTLPPVSSNDLAIDDFRVAKDGNGIVMYPDGRVEVRLEVDVRNTNSTQRANEARIMVKYNSSPTRADVPFVALGVSALGPEATHTVNGSMTFDANMQDHTVTLLAQAESISNGVIQGTEINTSIPLLVTLPQGIYNFVGQADQAEWVEYASPSASPEKLAFPSDVKSRGYALWVHDVPLEDERTVSRVLHTFPNSNTAGVIAGKFDLTNIEIESGDLIIARVGFLNGARQGHVRFVLQFQDQTAGSMPKTIDTHEHRYSGAIDYWCTILPPEVVGKKGYFYLRVEALDGSIDDQAVWEMAELVRP